MAHIYKKNILFIEDEANLIDIYHAIFDKHDYYFCSTANINEGMIIAKTANIDAILLDIILPKEENGVINIMAKQGFDFLVEVKKDPKTKNIPIIVFTNLNNARDRRKASELGATDYLVKADHDPEYIFNQVKEIIEENEAKTKK